MNYQQLKRLAKNTQRSVTNLLALSPKNDPFYVGTPSDILNAEWFLNLWTSFNYESGIHLRRMHYQIISQAEPVKMPNGNPYENTSLCWSFLGEASKSARYLGLVSPENFVDRRNPPAIVPPIVSQSFYTGITSDCFDGFVFPPMPDPPDYDYSIGTRQGYRIEIWCEKSTVNDVLIPLCSRYGATLQTGLGEMSITSILSLVQRIKDDRRPARIFYLSDFDPGGMSMPVATSRKLEYFLKDLPDADVRLYSIVLTADQVAEYRLPRTPIKETERRGAKFEARNGVGAVELDSLEALHPGVLKRIVETHLERYYDRTLHQRTIEFNSEIAERFEDVRSGVIKKYQADLSELEFEYQKVTSDAQARLEQLAERIKNLHEAIESELIESQPDIDPNEAPQAYQALELEDPLLDSTRDYLSQLDFYRTFQKEDRVVLIQHDLFPMAC